MSTSPIKGAAPNRRLRLGPVPWSFGPLTSQGSAVGELSLVQTTMRKRVSIALGIVTLVIVGMIFLATTPQPRIRITGDLPAKDVTRVLQLVRAEMRRDILPDLSWASVKDLPRTIRHYRSERLHSIDVQTNGTVCVQTVSDSSESYGSVYSLRRGREGWQIRESAWWMPSGIMTVESTVLPNKERSTE